MRVDAKITNSPDDKSKETKEKVKFYVQFMRPHKGPTNGGFQVYVQLDPEQQAPVYFRFDKTMVKARHERSGLFSCWSPEHDAGEVSIDVSPDKLHWTPAGTLLYEKDYTLLIRIAVVGACFALFVIGKEARKCYLKKRKARKSDSGQLDPLLHDDNDMA